MEVEVGLSIPSLLHYPYRVFKSSLGEFFQTLFGRVPF